MATEGISSLEVAALNRKGRLKALAEQAGENKVTRNKWYRIPPVVTVDLATLNYSLIK